MENNFENNIKQVTCCGAYVFKNNQVLLVKHKNGSHWDFPKGHMELGETKKETAVREVFEETSVKIKIVSDKEYTISYMPNPEELKTVIFFEAIPIEENNKLIKQEAEIQNLAWIDIEEAIEKITYENSKEAFKKFLEQNKKM